MRNFIVATDGSEGANHAVDAAAQLAKASGGKLVVMTVAGNLSGEEMRELARAERNIGDALEAYSMQIVTAAEKRAQHLGVTNIQLQIAWGDAARSIMEVAGREAGRGHCAWQARPGSIGRSAARQRVAESGESGALQRYHRSGLGRTFPR